MKLKEAEKLAIKLMKKYKLSHWTFKFDNAKRRYGSCSYVKKRITLSKDLTLIREDDHVTNTILHEIAHALVGPGHGHDSVWRAKALQIGCNGNRCSNDAKLPYRWIGVCPNGHTVGKYRRPRSNGSCAVCYPSAYNEKYKFEYSKK